MISNFNNSLCQLISKKITHDINDMKYKFYLQFSFCIGINIITQVSDIKL